MQIKCSCISYIIIAIFIQKCRSWLFYYYYSNHKGLALPRMEITLHILDHKMCSQTRASCPLDCHCRQTFKLYLPQHSYLWLQFCWVSLDSLSVLLFVGKLLVEANVNSFQWGLCLCLPRLRLGCRHPECHSLQESFPGKCGELLVKVENNSLDASSTEPANLFYEGFCICWYKQLVFSNW